MAGKRYSRQRELIYRFLMESKAHPTAEMVYRELKPGNPSLSLGTVYRNLNLLAEEGVIVRMPYSVERYDGNTEPHVHFRCRCCGGVFDMPFEYDNDLEERAKRACPHVIQGHSLTFEGICAGCVSQKEAM
jgi:Fur family peroxide stress response transcriptional regulator